MASIRWLHISDFHLDDKKDTYESDLVLNALVKSVRDWDDKPDVIFATGDVADKGKPAEYARATKFFDDLLEAAGGLSKDRLFVIPGNHDVDREAGEYLKRTLETESEAVKYFAPGARVPHRAKLEAYDQWYAEYFAGTARGVVDGGAWSTCRVHEVLEVDGVRLQVLTVNSALFCQGDDDNAKLWIGRRCLEEAVKELKDDVVRVCLIHHPVDWLSYDETAVVPALLQDNVDFILRGHLHQIRIVAEKDPMSGVLSMASGAAYQGRKWENQVLDVVLDVAKAEMRVRPLKYIDAPRSKWDLDTGVYSSKSLYEGVFSAVELKMMSKGVVAEQAATRAWGGWKAFISQSQPTPTGLFATVLSEIRNVIEIGDRLDSDNAERVETAKPHTVSDHRVQRVAKWLSARHGFDERFVNLTVNVTSQVDFKAQRYTNLGAVLADRPTGQSFVVLGDPGCGKTTLLKHLDYSLAMSGLTSSGSPIPFLLSLSSYRSSGESKLTPMDWLKQEWAKRLPQLPTLESTLDNSEVTILLDALNEMPHRDPAEFRLLADEWRHFIADQVRPRPGVRVVFTCRSFQFSRHLNNDEYETTHINVERLDNDQMRMFLRVYLPKNIDADETLTRIKADAQQVELFRIPFYLRMLTDQVRRTGNIPNDRARLFCGFLREHLRREANYEVLRSRDLVTSADFDFLNDPEVDVRAGTKLPEAGLLIPSLTRLAVGMLDRRGLDDLDAMQIRVSDTDAFDYMDVDPDTGKQIVRAGQAITVLDRDRVESEVMFFHQLWQEFFAARDPGSRNAILSAREGYEEAAVIAAGLTEDTSSLIQELLKSDPIIAAKSAMTLGGDLREGDRSAVQQALIRHMQNDATPSNERLEAGRALSAIQDPRPGVGLNDSGVPDISWISIPKAPAKLDESDVEKSAKTFRLSRYPVTVLQFSAFLDDRDGYEDARWWVDADGDFKKVSIKERDTYDNHPRCYVSYFEALAFCRWLSAKIGYPIRLPTEHEWETAARGRDRRVFPWGDDIRPSSANTADSNLNAPSAVGMYVSGRSPFDVMDMCGNVWEWCLDEATGQGVVRGGGFMNSSWFCTTYYKTYFPPGSQIRDTGFRLASDDA